MKFPLIVSLILALATSVCQSTALPAPPHSPVGNALSTLDLPRSAVCTADWAGPEPMDDIVKACNKDFDAWMKKHTGCDFDDYSMMVWDGKTYCGKADMEKVLTSMVPNEYYPISVSPQQCGNDGGFIILIRGYVMIGLVRIEFTVTVIFTYTGVVRNYYYHPY